MSFSLAETIEIALIKIKLNKCKLVKIIMLSVRNWVHVKTHLQPVKNFYANQLKFSTNIGAVWPTKIFKLSRTRLKSQQQKKQKKKATI